MVRPALVPELYVTDLARSLRFYVGALGFEIEYERPETGFAALNFLGSPVMLEEVAESRAASDQEFETGGWRTADLDFPFGRGVSFEITVPDVERMYAQVVDAGYSVKLGVRDRSYRVGNELVEVRQFLVMDPDGYLLRLAQRVGTRRARPA